MATGTDMGTDMGTTLVCMLMLDNRVGFLANVGDSRGYLMRDGALMDAIDVWCDAHPEATRVPRALGDHAFTVGGSSGRRRLLTYTQWMAQRPLAAYAMLSATDRPAVDAWLRRLGGDAARDAIARTVRHPLERHAFKLRLATRTPALASALTAGQPAAR